MNNQVKLIDRSKILSDLMRHIDSLNNDMNYAVHEGEESWADEISDKIELLQLFVDAIMAGVYKPTIKPGDKHRIPLSKGGNQMKREEILAMEPGDQLNALVAEFVMELPEVHFMDGSVWFLDKEDAYREVVNFSSDISAAWVVVDKIKSMLFSKRNKFLKELQALTNEDSEYCIAWPDVFWTITPERICKAAYLAVLEDINLPGEETE